MQINPFAAQAFRLGRDKEADLNALALPAPDDLVDTLEAGHRQIEAHLSGLEMLVPHVAAHGSDAAARIAALAAMRYFDTVAAAHHRNEDEILFPRLRAAAERDRRHEIAATLHELEREHETLDHLYRQVRARLEAVGRGGERGLDRGLVECFAWLYRRHMRLESGLLLPYAREALGGR